MYVRPLLSVSSLFLIAVFAAVPAAAADKPAEPAPAALHAQLTQISQDSAKLGEAIRRGE